MERQGERVSENSMVEQCLQLHSKNDLTLSAAAKRLKSGGGEKVCGKYHEPPWNQKREDWDSLIKS